MTPETAEAIARATTGRDMYLVPCEGGFRWSAYSEDDERDDYQPGTKPITTPARAVGGLFKAAGFLRGVDTTEQGKGE